MKPTDPKPIDLKPYIEALGADVFALAEKAGLPRGLLPLNRERHLRLQYAHYRKRYVMGVG